MVVGTIVVPLFTGEIVNSWALQIVSVWFGIWGLGFNVMSKIKFEPTQILLGPDEGVTV